MSETQDESQDRSQSSTDQAPYETGYLSQVIAETLQLIAESAHVHRWAILGVWNSPVNRPVHPRLLGNMQTTIALVRCQECGVPETTELEGIWTLEQLTASARIEGE